MKISQHIRLPLAALLLVWGAIFSFGLTSLTAQEPTPLSETQVLDDADVASSETQASDDSEEKPSIPRNPQEILEALGWLFVAPFLAASFISLWFGLERLVILRRSRVIPRAFVERFIKHLEQGSLEPQKALDLCLDNGSPTARVFAHGIRKWGRPSVEVEQAIIDGGERQVSLLRKHLRVLNGVATVTPLIGLLGTVIGMIRAFNEIANSDAMGKATQLASGIALALLTTAAGLMIAIPSLILYMYLAGKVDSVVMEMDRHAQRVVELISSEGLAARGNRSSTMGKRAS